MDILFLVLAAFWCVPLFGLFLLEGLDDGKVFLWILLFLTLFYGFPAGGYFLSGQEKDGATYGALAFLALSSLAIVPGLFHLSGKIGRRLVLLRTLHVALTVGTFAAVAGIWIVGGMQEGLAAVCSIAAILLTVGLFYLMPKSMKHQVWDDPADLAKAKAVADKPSQALHPSTTRTTHSQSTDDELKARNTINLPGR